MKAKLAEASGRFEDMKTVAELEESNMSKEEQKLLSVPYKPFNTFYDQHVQRWLRAHPGRGFGEFQVAAAVCEAFGKAATMSIATNGFKKCGIWPLNKYIFGDHEYQGCSNN